MKNKATSSYFSDGHQRRILGFPERTLYRVGVFVFYILLFFAVSVISNNMTQPNSQATISGSAK